MIDWNGLVLGPLMTIFGQAITVTPVASQPNVPAYQAQGIFKADPASVALLDGEVVASTIYTLGIRLSDFIVPIASDDQIAVASMSFLADQIHPDGQGGAVVTLKRSS